MRKEDLAYVGPDRLGLLIDLSSEIDDSKLVEIANADYGDDADEHLNQLKKIRDTQVFGTRLNWCPREVLELVRWSDPDDPDQKPGYRSQHGHLKRAFCCTALLCAGDIPENVDVSEGENQTIAQLLDSLRYLDNDTYTTKAAKLVAHRLMRLSERNEERPFFILALMILLLRMKSSERLVGELAEWLLEEESRIRNSEWATCPDTDERWLLGLTHYDIRHNIWVQLGGELQELESTIRDATTIASVGIISAKLRHNNSLKSDAAKPRTLG